MMQQAPSDWTQSNIRELEDAGDIELGRGKIISQKDIEADPGDFPVYSSSASGSGEFGRYGKFMFDEELVTWSVDGGGKFFYRPKGKFSITNVSGFLRIKSKDKLDAYYAWAHLFSLWQTMTFNYTEKLHPTILRERFSFSYPPLAEQKKIASTLAVVQEAIAQQERLIRTTTELKQALMQKLFTEGLRGEALKETEIGMVPESWEVVKMEDVCEVITDYVSNGSFASLRENVTYLREPGHAILIRVADYSKGFKGPFVYVDEKAYHFLEKSKVYSGDIIVGNVGSVGTAFEAPKLDLPLSIAPNALLIRSKAKNRFLYYLILSPGIQHHIQRISSKIAQPKFNKTQFRNMKVALPDLAEQERIAEALGKVDEKLNYCSRKLDSLQDLFRTLLHELMTGKVRIPATPIEQVV